LYNYDLVQTEEKNVKKEVKKINNKRTIQCKTKDQNSRPNRPENKEKNGRSDED